MHSNVDYVPVTDWSNFKVNMAKELAALGRMEVTQLREKHIEVFGDRTRPGNKD